MGYQTDFTGHVTVTPALNQAEAAFLHAFADSRRMDREAGPYGCGDDGVRNYNLPPAGQPGLWCDWAPTDDNAGLEWNGMEKFYESEEWMRYLIDHFLRPGGEAQGQPGFDQFTFDHVVSGTIDAQGEDPSDRWQLRVVDNIVVRALADRSRTGDGTLTVRTVRETARLSWSGEEG